jgi:uncharacterized protein with ParB-like and HNH nuclease domain
MREFIDTQQVKLKTILEDESRYIIPRFQREYSWRDEHIEEFWRDLIDNFNLGTNEPYFFGTFVLIANNEPEEYNVVDGQQRLATTITLLCTIRDFLSEYGREHDADNVQYFIKVDETSTSSYPYRLKMSRNNQDFFEAKILNLDTASHKNNVIFNDISKRNKGLAKAYRIFYEKISKELETTPEKDEKIKFLVKLSNYFIKYFVIVRNIIDTPERAYRIFDTINNRGIGLAQSDLVKNYLLEVIDRSSGEIDVWYNKWLEMLAVLDIAHVKEADFLRHYLMAYYGPTSPKEVFDTVLRRVRTKEQVEEFLDHIYTSAKIYRRLKEPDITDWSGDKDILENLSVFKSLSAKVVYPVLLKGVDVFGNDRKNLLEFINNLLIFFFRSRTICQTNASALETLMNTICKELRDNTAVTVSDIKNMLKKSDEYQTDEKFKFEFSIFDATAKNALYILTNLNMALHGGRKEMTLSAVKDNVSIEHIMPKVISNSEWEIYLKNKKGFQNTTELEDYHKNNLWKIGNLTILNRSKNFKAHNISFMDKFNQVYKTDDAKIVNHLNNWHEWNDETIDERQTNLAGIAVNIWKLDD